MLTATSTVFLAAVLIGLIIGFIALIVLQVLMSARVSRLTSPIYEYALAKSEADADRIVREAQEKARALLTEAENGVAALAAQQRGEIEGHAKAYRETLEAFASQMQKTVTQSVETAQHEQSDVAQSVTKAIRSHGEAFEKHLTEMQNGLDSFSRDLGKQVQDARAALAARATEAGERLEKTFAETGAENKARVDKRLEELFAQAQTEVDAYREARKRIIDTNMVELIGETAKLVLRKALSTSDHGELVRLAL